MKTIIEHLSNLEEPYRTKALKCLESETVSTQSEALMHAFDWSESEEGSHYWDDLYNRLKKQEQTE